ncbi:hypothetical protein GQR58_026065 [Nymphon striatum]|nr:hypothetical protein GQR58_026065 [Nymphon striatum]
MATQSKWLRSLTQADQLDKARLLAAASPKSGSWLEVLPVPNLGTRLDDEAFRIGIGLRIGTALCQPHKCRCGSTVDARGLHPLSCKYSEGRFPRHGAINDIVKHALGVAGFPSQLEPVELDRGDGKRPDGLTTFSYKMGKSMVWDVTVVDSYAATNINASAIKASSAAANAEEAKSLKYAALSQRYIFEGLAFVTSGELGPNAARVINEIGDMMRRSTGSFHTLRLMCREYVNNILEEIISEKIMAGLMKGIATNDLFSFEASEINCDFGFHLIMHSCSSLFTSFYLFLPLFTPCHRFKYAFDPCLMILNLSPLFKNLISISKTPIFHMHAANIMQHNTDIVNAPPTFLATSDISTGQFELISSSRYNREWFPSNSQAVSFNIFELILKTTILDIRAAAMTVVTLKHRNQTQIQQQQYLAYQGLTCQDSEYNRATLDYCEENPHQSSVTYPVVTSSDTKSSRATLRSECTFKGSSHSKVYSEVLTSFEFLMNSEVSSSNGDEAAFKEILIYQTLGQNTAQPNRVKFEASKMCSHQYVVNGSSGNGGHQQITHYQYSSS